MTRDQALEKIRKLLSNRGRTDHEIDTAQILAACIAEKHGIDIAEVDRAEQDRSVVHEIFGEWASVPDEAIYASLICSRFFEVSPFTSGYWTQRMIVVGTPHHLVIARYVFGFLTGEFRRCWNRRPNKRIKKRKAFIHGAYVALFTKLVARFEQPFKPQLELALEVNWKAKRESYIQENFGEMTTKPAGPKKVGAAARHGYQAGSSIEIRPAVNGHQNGRAPALLAPSNRLLPAPSNP